MRLRSLGRLTCGFLLLALGVPVRDASAQGSPLDESCLGNGASGSFEIGVVVVPQAEDVDFVVAMVDMETGADIPGSRQTINVGTYEESDCQYRAYAGGVGPSGGGDDPLGVGYAVNHLYRIDIAPAKPGTGPSASYYTYFISGCPPGSSVFCPQAKTSYDTVIFIYDEVRLYPDVLPAAYGAGLSVEEIFYPGVDSWVLPYDFRTICAQYPSITGCSGTNGPAYGSYTFFAPAPLPGTGPTTLPITLKAAYGADWQIPTGTTQNWSANDVSEIRFGPGGKVTVREAAGATAAGVLNVTAASGGSGVTLTASDASAGWAGVRFNAGSDGTWTETIVERVGAPASSGFGPPVYVPSISVTGASPLTTTPTFTDVTIQDPATGQVHGLVVTGAGAALVATELTVQRMTGAGVVVSGGGRVDLVRGTITGNDGAGFVASGGSPLTTAYLVPASGAGGFRGPQITGNDGGGVAAGAGAEVRFGPQANPGYGRSSVTGNDGRGLLAIGGAAIYAGTTTTYQRNRVFANAPFNSAGNALASGGSSRLYARCNWWTTQDAFALRVGTDTGGTLDASRVLTADPDDPATPNPSCVIPTISWRPAAGAAWTGRGGATAARDGEPETALDRLAAAVDTTAAEAVGLLAALVADEPESAEAAAALGEAGGIAGRPGAPASATALLDGATASAYAPLRAAAWQGLVSARRAQGDRLGALAATDALAAEGGASVVQAEVARVYLHAEGADTTAAVVALAALEALAPDGVEVELARALLGVEGPQTGGRGAGAGSVAEARGAAGTDGTDGPTEAVTLAVGPNPAGLSAAITLTLAAAGDVEVVVYDLLGRAVEAPLVGALTSGAYRAAVDVGGLAPGVYVVRASVNTAAGPVVRTARLTVAR